MPGILEKLPEKNNSEKEAMQQATESTREKFASIFPKTTLSAPVELGEITLDEITEASEVAKIINRLRKQVSTAPAETNFINSVEKKSNLTLRDHVTAMCDAVIGESQGIHNENIVAENEFAIADGTYRVSVEKLGQTELLTRDVERWIANPKSKDRPPRFKDREPVNGKKLNERQFFESVYQKFIAAKAIYRDKLTKIDKELVNHLPSYFTEDELETVIPTKSARIKAELISLAKKGFDKKKLNNLVQAYRH